MTDLRWSEDGSDAAVAAVVAAVVAAPGTKQIALPGGATPGPVFARLSSQNLDWPSVTLWPTDERIVSPAHKASNIGALMKAFAATGARLQPLAAGQPVPQFDLVWLGMGADGHIASLFPSLNPDPDAPAGVFRATPEPLPPEAPFERLTMSLAALANARQIILVVRGDAKRGLLVDAAAGANDLPVARLLRSATCPVTAYWSPS